ncbi:hypothetical protein PR002_g30700 [Phytophthora rubi]|uniref:Uncharacterized protein n=1 Tax=Phytophthora rubi TaxID=129364 RepID=A0A6A3GNC0_9STRA|nr:hypothetical protein PR002_g30700 [Phytophthora rubi]
MAQARTGANGCRLSLLLTKGCLLLTNPWQCCRPGDLGLWPWPLDMHAHVLILNSAASQAPNQRATTATSPKSCKSERDSLQRATSLSMVLSTTTAHTTTAPPWLPRSTIRAELTSEAALCGTAPSRERLCLCVVT